MSDGITDMMVEETQRMNDLINRIKSELVDEKREKIDKRIKWDKVEFLKKLLLKLKNTEK